ncbi:Protein HAIKU1 [Raphanus sativus]|uniref:Protein HAIKU1-like n=1 Tax=Raphanus sativus TaxID=3726 RepID=A0A6J0LH13_RAPSA|nr:protein HAIKU1-like [Raphanus sativus]KAJ4907060.1 Protein HAIKU1 [Raphanus sativus]
MDRPQENDHYLGVNKIGKNIRKSPLHQPQPSCAAHANLAAADAAARPQAQPQVYNINRNDFRSIVQQLTGSPSPESLHRPLPPQNNNSPKPQNTRLQRIRPPPLTQINRPAMASLQQHHPHCLIRPPPPQGRMPQGIQQQQQQPMMGHGDQFWSNTAESPVSEYMRYLQSPFGDAGPSGNQMQPGHGHRPYMSAQPQSQPQPYMPGHEHRPYMPAQPQPYMPGHEHGPYMPAQSQPQPYMPAQPQLQPQPEPYMMSGSQPQMNMQGCQYPPPPPGLFPSPVPPNLPLPQFNDPVPVTPSLPSPSFNQMYGGLPSPQYNGFGFGQPHSPTSQSALPSLPTSYPNMLSPRSPGVQYPQPLTPNFSFSQLDQSGSLGPGAGSGPPQPPPPPPGLFPVPSPRWGDY